ncbi:TonB-dependent receptor plug domain-containing protein, partial [Psychrobacter sp. Rd 27.2]|uniref:TonB-dependent receptor plug domain-containing protein n=2 Tax=Moraxellaceae TaxID=468 RepID=UPI00095EFB31
NQKFINSKQVASSDTATILTKIPGLNVQSAGGISNLPVMRGLADNRLRVLVDGVDSIASCPNSMNSPLSYIAPSSVDETTVYAGVTPVSVGGNSIGG